MKMENRKKILFCGIIPKKKKKKTEIFVQSIREHKNDSCQQFNNTAEISGMNEVNEN